MVFLFLHDQNLPFSGRQNKSYIWVFFSQHDVVHEMCRVETLSNHLPGVATPGSGFLNSMRPWGLAEIVHEEAYPYLPESFKSVLETVDTSTVNISLFKFVPSINNSLCGNVFPNIHNTSMFNNFSWMASSLLLTINCEERIKYNSRQTTLHLENL